MILETLINRNQDVSVSEVAYLASLLLNLKKLVLKLIIPMQLLNVLLYQPLLKDSSLTLPTTHLIMSWALWPLIPVNLGSFWTSPWGNLR